MFFIKIFFLEYANLHDYLVQKYSMWLSYCISLMDFAVFTTG